MRNVGHEKPNRDRKELAKQLGKYADATTAFVVLQSIAFSFSLGSKDIGERIRHAPPYLIQTLCCVSLAFYILIITSCFVGENKLLANASRDEATRRWAAIVCFGRCLLAALAEAAVLVGVHYTRYGG